MCAFACVFVCLSASEETLFITDTRATRIDDAKRKGRVTTGGAPKHLAF